MPYYTHQPTNNPLNAPKQALNTIKGPVEGNEAGYPEIN